MRNALLQLAIDERSPAELREVTEEVMRREFERQPNLLERFQQWLINQLNRIGVPTGPSVGSMSVLTWVIVAILVVILIALIVALVRALARRAEKTPKDDDPVTESRRRPAEEWAEDVDDAVTVGDWRAAILARYREIVSALDRVDGVDFMPGMTPMEISAHVTQRWPESTRALDRVTEIFERVWYGGDESTRDLVDEMTTHGASVRSAVVRRHVRIPETTS